MKFLEIDHKLNTSFWDEYAVLWQNSRDKSPFQAPEILKYFSGKLTDKVVAIRLIDDQKLIAAVLLKKERDIFTFLSDLKTDSNFFVFHNECSADDFQLFFSELMKIIRSHGWAVDFNKVPAWTDYFYIFEQCAVKGNLFYQAMNYSVCPVLRCDTPEEIRNIITRSRTLRNNANNLRGRFNAEFEVLTGDEDLESWVQEFCNSHILRWEKTSTPSVYRNSERQFFLLKCLCAWSADKVLVRFAVKVKQQRIGFHICLIEGNSLIGHSMIYHPDYYKFSPAKVLLVTIAEWMIEKRLNIFNFGNGNETYKYNYSNEEFFLKRVFLSKRTNFSFVTKVKLIKLIKGHSIVYHFYKENIKKYLNQNRDAKIKTGNT